MVLLVKTTGKGGRAGDWRVPGADVDVFDADLAAVASRAAVWQLGAEPASEAKGSIVIQCAPLPASQCGGFAALGALGLAQSPPRRPRAPLSSSARPSRPPSALPLAWCGARLGGHGSYRDPVRALPASQCCGLRPVRSPPRRPRGPLSSSARTPGLPVLWLQSSAEHASEAKGPS